MKRLLGMLVAAAATLSASVLAASTSSAQESPFSYVTPVSGATPAEACRNSDNVIAIQFVIDGEVVQEPLAGPGELSTGACVSTITRQELTTAAYVASCKLLEPFFAESNPSGRPYPYSFYGNPDYTAKNRAGCVYFLRGFHTGTIPPGP